MRNHGKDRLNKVMEIRTIRKIDTQPRDLHARSNLEKVSRTKVPPKRRYIHSPRKGKQSKERSRDSSQSSPENVPDERAPENFQKDDCASNPSEEFDIDTSNLPSRRSHRIRNRTTPYGTNPDDTEGSLSENEFQPPMKKFSGIANFQAPQTEQAQPTTAVLQEEYATPHAEEGHVRTNVNLITTDPSEKDSEVPTRSIDDLRELNPDEL